MTDLLTLADFPKEVTLYSPIIYIKFERPLFFQKTVVIQIGIQQVLPFNSTIRQNLYSCFCYFSSKYSIFTAHKEEKSNSFSNLRTLKNWRFSKGYYFVIFYIRFLFFFFFNYSDLRNEVCNFCLLKCFDGSYYTLFLNGNNKFLATGKGSVPYAHYR